MASRPSRRRMTSALLYVVAGVILMLAVFAPPALALALAPEAEEDWGE